MPDAIRVVLVDDHAVVREGVRQVLASDPQFRIVGEAGTAAEALQVIERENPDVVLLDINLPDESGLWVVGQLRARAVPARILMLSVNDDREFVLESIRSGAHGYLRKDTTPADLRAAIRAVQNGDSYLSPPIARHVTDALRADPGAPTMSNSTTASPEAVGQLSNREREVLIGVARGQMNKEIAAQLGISVRTVEAHRDSLMRKLQLRSPAALTRFALENGLLGEERRP